MEKEIVDFYNIRSHLKYLIDNITDEYNVSILKRMYDSYVYPEIEMTDMYECAICKKTKHKTEFPIRREKDENGNFIEGRTYFKCQRCFEYSFAKLGCEKMMGKEAIVMRKEPPCPPSYEPKECELYWGYGCTCDLCQNYLSEHNRVLNEMYSEALPQWIIEAKILVNRANRKYTEYLKKNKLKI